MRDIERVKKIFHFCTLFTKLVNNLELDHSDFDSAWKKLDLNKEWESDDELTSKRFLETIILTVSLNYIFRLFDKGNF